MWCLTPSASRAEQDGLRGKATEGISFEETNQQRPQKSHSFIRGRRPNVKLAEGQPVSSSQGSQRHSLCRSEVSKSSVSSQQLFEGGSLTGDREDQEAGYHQGEHDRTNSVIEEEDEDGALDPDDPYQINRLNEIPHEQLKELYTQVVDELLDIQLEFEEKLAEVEEQAHLDVQEVQRQKDEAEDKSKK